MKISFLSGDITLSGGTENVACQIMNGLAQYHDIKAVSFSESNDAPFYYLSPNVHRLALFDKQPNGIKQYPQIVRAIRAATSEDDILIDVDTMLDAFSVPALIGNHTKLVAWEHFFFEESLNNRFRIPVRKVFTRRADCVVTITKQDRDMYLKHFHGKTRIAQIYNPVSFVSDTDDYDEQSKTIISVGNLNYTKGFDMLLNVAEIVLKNNPEWSWLILGEGEDRPLLEKGIEEKNLRNLHLMGKVQNVSEYLHRSSIFALTSRFEGFGMVVVEAQAANLPVVAFDCKVGPGELILNDVNGYLIPCYDIVQMAQKINRLIKDVDLRCSFSHKAKENLTMFDRERIIQQWHELLTDL